MSPTEKRVHVNGIDLVYFEWGAAPGVHDTGVILFAHATGFHARVWDRTIAALRSGARVISLDMRGHGRSDKQGPYTWGVFGRDVLETVVTLDLRDIVGVGHSMGGHAMTQAVAGEQSRFRRLLLVDPMIMDPAMYPGRGRSGMPSRLEDHATSKRKNDWSSWEEMFTRFEARHPFNLWRREVLEDYCRHGVLPNPDGPGFVLACPPRVEASIYTGSVGRDIYSSIRAISLPVTVLRAKARAGARQDAMDFAPSPTWPGLAGEFRHGRDVFLPDLTHFIPMQDPALVAAYVDSDTRG